MKFELPLLESISIDHFSLYEKKDSIKATFDKDVFCLIGANGLGKSTFISIINFALTGIVKKHDVNFASSGTMPQFYSQNKAFAYEYFNGRIDEEDRESSSVKLKFKIAQATFEITRNFFEVDALKYLKISSDKLNIEFDSESGDITGSDILSYYEKEFLKYSRIEQFDQFVFLQIFVLSFDESHALLVWDDKVLERVLHITFAVDPKQAQKADQLRKQISKFDSQARNKQYSITQVERLIKETEIAIRNGTNDLEDDSVAEKYDDYIHAKSRLNERKEYLLDESKDTDVFIAEKSLAVADSRKEYEIIFSKIEKTDINLHEIIDIQERLCQLSEQICAHAI